MPHRARPMTGLLVFMGVNLALFNTISPVYDFVCFHPYWERRTKNVCVDLTGFVVLVFRFPIQTCAPPAVC
ncbi:hypothetical protein ZEAMMB73_Zm00001d004999 [Zea mays]|uniref:Uncharacterized protein n=1 Tax=Zea mays TaxID=4577 RepID=A0A1D6EIK7_MAIZE|nr:hypothetical protein ZEAMMB73_Zm00001d004999 [Zea mays]